MNTKPKYLMRTSSFFRPLEGSAAPAEHRSMRQHEARATNTSVPSSCCPLHPIRTTTACSQIYPLLRCPPSSPVFASPGAGTVAARTHRGILLGLSHAGLRATPGIAAKEEAWGGFALLCLGTSLGSAARCHRSSPPAKPQPRVARPRHRSPLQDWVSGEKLPVGSGGARGEVNSFQPALTSTTGSSCAVLGTEPLLWSPVAKLRSQRGDAEVPARPHGQQHP